MQTKHKGLARVSFAKQKLGGFTLIELLVVIAIIGLLSSVVFASLNSARVKGRDANRVSTLKQIANAVNLADADPALAFSCNTAHVDISTCTIASTPSATSFAQFKDPSTTGTACTNASAATCQYSVAKSDGTAAATTQNYEVCSYLEVGAGVLPAGRVRIGSDTGGGIVAGCI